MSNFAAKNSAIHFWPKFILPKKEQKDDSNLSLI